MKILSQRLGIFSVLFLLVCGLILIGSCRQALVTKSDPLSDLFWPNQISSANSDRWLRENHDRISQLRPRILALNFVNSRSMSEMRARLSQAIAMFAEASRYHGYDNPDSFPFIQYQLAITLDMRDRTIPQNWPYRNSTSYPREDPQQGHWSLDYGKLFTPEYAKLYNIRDSQTGQVLGLCDLFEQGAINEVWIYGDADIPEEVDGAEILELKPFYDRHGNRSNRPMNRCAGNGCFDEEDEIPCRNTVRIAWFNNTRGPGCFMESLSHGIERMAVSGTIPYLTPYFVEFAGLNLSDRYDLPVSSWYACPYGEPCLQYPSETSLEYRLPQGRGRIENYDPICGNVHFSPNATQHYDLDSPYTVQTSCSHYRDGSGQKSRFTSTAYDEYRDLANDCQGAWAVWWWQNFPGLNNTAKDNANRPMRNWWPYLYY